MDIQNTILTDNEFINKVKEAYDAFSICILCRWF